jgi:hypothetical protein
MSRAIEECLARLANRVSDVRRRTMANDVNVVSANRVTRDAVAAERSATYIWLCASLEGFIKEILAALLTDLNNLQLRRADVQPSLFALLHAPEFDRLRVITGQTMWNERADLFCYLNDRSPAIFALDRLPLDGKTIQPRHLETIWRVFPFAGGFVPTPRHKLALIDLSEMRNKLAHGELEPVSFGRTKPFADVLRVISVVEDVGEHITLTSLTYLSAGGYQR